MNKSDLEKLCKDELIKLLLNQQARQSRRPIPSPRKSVKQLVQDYENDIILPPPEFRDKPVPLPRTKKPIPLPRTKITKRKTALKYHTTSFEIDIKNHKDPLQQLQNTRKAVAYYLIHLLSSMKGLKYVECIKATYIKIRDGEIEHKTAYFFSSPNTVLNNLDVHKSLQLSKNHILEQMSKLVSEGSGWTIESVDNHYLNVVRYKPMSGSSYIDIPKELKNGKKGLINMKNNDNECYRWCHIRHLNPQAKNPQRIKRADKAYVQNLDYSGIEFPVTLKQYNKIEIKTTYESMCLVMRITNHIQSMYRRKSMKTV